MINSRKEASASLKCRNDSGSLNEIATSHCLLHERFF